MEDQPLLQSNRPDPLRRGTVTTIAGAGNNFSLLQKRSRSILDKTWINTLLIFVPFGILSGFLDWPASAIFALNFLALIPLENVFHLVAEKLILPLGQQAGTVLSVVLPHVFPLIIGITSIACGNVRLGQTFVIGSLLCNHLLGLGGCFLVSSFGQLESIFPATGTNTEACLLYLIATPLAMCKLLSPEFLDFPYDSDYAILFLSHYAAIILLVLYIMFLFFRLHSHRYLWQDEESIEYPDDEEHNPPPYWGAYILALILIIGLAILCAKFLVTSVPGLVVSSHITEKFTGLVLLPIITHLCKYIKTSVIAYQGHPEIAVAMTLGASVDVAFFALPVLVLVGWVIGQPMTMEFELLETIITVLSILVMAGFVMDGKSNYLEGAMSLGLYGIIVLTYAITSDPQTGV